MMTRNRAMVAIGVVATLLVLLGGLYAVQQSRTESTRTVFLTDAKRAKIERVLELSGAKAEVTDALGRMQQSLRDYGDREVAVLPRLSDADALERKKVTDPYKTKINDQARRLTWESVHPQVVEHYHRTYTEEELATIIRFFSSPGGKAMRQNAASLNLKVRGSVLALQDEVAPTTFALTNEMKQSTARFQPQTQEQLLKSALLERP